MVNKLQVIFERQVAIRAIEPCSVAAFPCSRGAGWEDGGAAEGGGDIKAGGAGVGVAEGGRGWRSSMVFAAEKLGFVPGGGFGFEFALAEVGLFGVVSTVPGAAETGGVAGVGGGGFGGFAFGHFFLLGEIYEVRGGIRSDLRSSVTIWRLENSLCWSTKLIVLSSLR